MKLKLTPLEIPRRYTKTFNFLKITAGGRLNFFNTRIMSEYDFSKVKSFILTHNREENPSDESLYLVPDVVNAGTPIEIQYTKSDQNSPYISMQAALKTYFIKFPADVDYKIIDHEWHDGSTKKVIELKTALDKDELAKEKAKAVATATPELPKSRGPRGSYKKSGKAPAKKAAPKAATRGGKKK